MDKLSVVIPCYGSEKTIQAVVEQLTNIVQSRPALEYEIILVNDCSPDNVSFVLRQMAEQDSHVKVVELARNFGQHNAIMAGFEYVTGDVVVCMDDDGQTPANEIFKLTNTIDEGYDVVFAKYESKQHSLGRNIGSKLNDLMAQFLLGKPKDLSMMSYFAARRYIVDEIRNYKSPYPYMGGLLLRSTKNITNVQVAHRERMEGNSGYTLTKLISLWMNGFTAFSIKPLRVSSFIGFLSAFGGVAYMLYIIVNKLFNPGAPMGYSSIMAVLLLVGGITMLLLGLIGEYVGRIYISINQSPQYVIRNTINTDGGNEANR